MNKLQELLAELEAVDTKIDALLTHDELTAEQQTEHDDLVKEREKLTGKVKREQDRIAREDERQKLADEAKTRKQGTGRKTENDPPKTDDVPGAEERQNATRIPATVKRFGTLRNFTSKRDGIDPDVRAYRFGMWALAQLSFQMPGRYRFNEAVEFFNAQWGAVHQSNNATGVQNLIPTEFGTDLIVQRERFGVARRLFLPVPMSSDTRTDPREQSGLSASFVGEGTAGTESNNTYDNVRLTAKDLMALTRMSRNVQADEVIGLADRLLGNIGYAFAYKEDLCAFIGDATSTYGGIRGIVTRLQSFDGNGTDSYGLVTGTGNAYSELVLRDFQKVVAKLPQWADTPNTAWAMHRTFYYEVCEPLVLASGGTSAMEVRDGERRPRPLFLGYPVEFAQAMPKTEGNSQVCATLGDYAQGASFGDRQQEEITFSEHATIGGENVFERNQVAIRGLERFDINVHSVGNADEAGAIVGLQTAAA